MHYFVVYLGRAAGHVAEKTSANMRFGFVNFQRWLAAPRYNFFIDTLTPLTLVDVVVLRHEVLV
jgi:hypothetical protein